MSFFLREVISAAGAARPQVGSLRAHEVRSVSTSVAFHRNWSVTSVLESATWASSSVFSSFYLRDIQHEFDGLLSFGPFAAAGSRIGYLSPLLISSGGGGGAISSWFPLSQGSSTFLSAGCGACPTCCLGGC